MGTSREKDTVGTVGKTVLESPTKKNITKRY